MHIYNFTILEKIHYANSILQIKNDKKYTDEILDKRLHHILIRF